jgi:hypothetical protein
MERFRRYQAPLMTWRRGYVDAWEWSCALPWVWRLLNTIRQVSGSFTYRTAEQCVNTTQRVLYRQAQLENCGWMPVGAAGFWGCRGGGAASLPATASASVSPSRHWAMFNSLLIRASSVTLNRSPRTPCGERFTGGHVTWGLFNDAVSSWGECCED